MSATRNEIRTVALEQLAYISRHYPIDLRIGIKTIIGHRTEMSPEVTIIFSELSSNTKSSIEAKCTIWMGNEDYDAIAILDVWNTQTGDSVLHEVANLSNLEDILSYLEKSIQLFGLEETE